MKKIGVLTTGGDASGMNPAIRAVVRSAISLSMEVVGIQRGYKGLNEKLFVNLNSRDVAGIINRGGTILRTNRFPQFSRVEVRRKCMDNLLESGVEGLVIIGGDGSARGAYALWSDFKYPVVFIPASIDNDIYGTDFTIGFDTAVNTALSAIDSIRDTATSHERTFVIEVMGREKGNIAIEVGLACGAEIVIIPEFRTDREKIVKSLVEQEKKGKNSSIIIIAEGAGSAEEFSSFLQQRLPERQVRYSVLGYIQRGGSPTYLTRVLAARFGSSAPSMLAEGKYPCMVGIKGTELVHVPLEEVVSNCKVLPYDDLELVAKMAI